MSPQTTPFIWFDADPHEVRDFYSSVFDDLETLSEMRGPDGTVLGVTVSLDGTKYSLFNGGSGYPHTNAFSLMIHTDDQEQTDRYWNALLADGGEPNACGWLTDKYGIKWQVTPKFMMDVLEGDNAEGRERAFNAMLTMGKLNLADLQAAYNGEPPTS